MRVIQQIPNVGGNASLSVGSSAGILGFLTQNYSLVMMSIAFAGLVFGVIFKYLHYSLEKKKVENASRANNK